jgi:hypothetical protein
MTAKKTAATMFDIQRVFDAWAKHRPKPALCKLTSDRSKLIASRMGLGYSADDLCALVEYVFEADDSWCKFMRGDNDRDKDYTALDSLLRKEKLADRVEKALLWRDAKTASTTKPTAASSTTGVDFGAMGAFRARPFAGEA